MENLETLLKYQEIDIKLKRALDSIEKSDATKKMEYARNEFNNAKKTVLDSEKKAENLVNNYKQYSSQFKEIADKFDEVQLIVENAESDDDLSELSAQLEALKAQAIALERKLIECRTMSEDIVKTYQEANSIGFKMRDHFNSAKADREKLVKGAESEIFALKRQLKEMETQIDKELMAKYKSITDENKYPAFVEARISGGICSCGGCGLQFSQKNQSILNENGMCTCENCRRMVYKR